VLGDLIDSGAVHVSKLTDVMRQKENSNIIKYCTDINEGKVFDPIEEYDFHYEEFGEGSELKDFFFEKYKEEVEKYGLNEVQVITPYKRGELGMYNLNNFIQEKYNKDGLLTIEPYRLGDKVRHTQNNYKKEVFNGETGTIIRYDDEEEEILVDFGNKMKWYNKEESAELTLSYVSTVHASQGSEYKSVFVILDDTSVNDFLLIRRLLYTAVSRGKSKVWILSKPYLVDKCIENDSYRPRITKLKEYLNEK
jgi:exodeoxyribonuclease V alpha subunit